MIDLQYQDKQLNKYYKEYTRQRLSLMDEVQSIVDMGFTYEELNSYNKDLDRFKRETLKAIDNGTLDGYNLYMAQKMLNRNKIKNKDMLYWLILYKYFEFIYQMEAIEKEVINAIDKHFIEETIKQCERIVDKTYKINSENLINEAMQEPNNLGYEWNTYKTSITEYNASEMYDNIVLNLRNNKNKVNRDILERQQNRMIKKTKTKFTGALDNQIDFTTSYIQLHIFEKFGIKKARIMGVLDERTCEVCDDYIGKVYKLEDIVIGVQVNSHPNCRCYLEPVKEYE